MAGGELRAPRGPVHPHGHELFAEDDVVVLAPGDRLPAVLPAGHRARPWPHRAAPGAASSAGRAPADAAGARSAAARTSSGRRTPKVLLTPTT